MQVPVLETPDGPIFESNAIARYGMIILFFLFVGHLLVDVWWVKLSWIVMFLVSVTRLKADNPLYGSTLIEYVSSLSLYL